MHAASEFFSISTTKLWGFVEHILQEVKTHQRHRRDPLLYGGGGESSGTAQTKAKAGRDARAAK